jgi:5-methylcytosine-specific restriction endonuclease McrA
MKGYSKYISSETWATKRRARLEIDGYRCRLCDEDGKTYRLEVHHRPSSYSKIPNESVADDLITVCSRCHDHITDSQRRDRYGVKDIKFEPVPRQELKRVIPEVGIIKKVQFQPIDIIQSIRRIPEVV